VQAFRDAASEFFTMPAEDKLMYCSDVTPRHLGIATRTTGVTTSSLSATPSMTSSSATDHPSQRPSGAPLQITLCHCTSFPRLCSS
jgi:isopenicillin N synthase-like dioxygenase